MKIFRYLLIIVFVLAAFEACKEEDRYQISSKDNTVPPRPVIDSVRPLNGGARVFFQAPKDTRVLQTVAEYTASNGKTFTYNASYFKDSLDVYGFANTENHTFYMYAESRSGVKSVKVPVTVKPKIPSIKLVQESMRLGPGFGALYVEWINKLKHTVNVFVDLEFRANGEQKNPRLVYSSNRDSLRQFVRDLNLLPGEPIKMKIYVGDVYGNLTPPKDTVITLLEDMAIPKIGVWKLPKTGDFIGGIPMMHGTYLEGSNSYLIDGIIDRAQGMFNFCHTMDKGRIGLEFFDFPVNKVPVPNKNQWNLMIDLGDYYELSRIVTHQRHSMTDDNLRGQLYRDENVGYYAVYYLDENDPAGIESEIHGEKVKGVWVQIMEYKIPVPIGIQPVEYPRLGLLGDEAYMKPVTPGFTPPTRWFRYEARNAFGPFTNGIPAYTNINNNNLSEVTLYGRLPVKK